MRRRRNNYYGRNRHRDYINENEISFDEFKFYVNKQKLIEKSELKIMDEKFAKGKEFYWTNEEYAEHNIGFKFFMRSSYDDDNKEIEEEYVEFIETEFKFKKDDFINMNRKYGPLLLMFDIPKEDINKLDKCFRSNKFVGNYETYNIKDAIVCHTFDDAVNTLIVNKCMGDESDMCWDDFHSITKNLFNKDLRERKYKDNNDGSGYNTSCYHMFKIIERRINDKNYRIAFVSQIGKYDLGFEFLIVDENDSTYNYFDENNVFVKKDRSDKMSFLPDNSAIIGEDLSITIDIETCKLLRDNIGDILGPDEYKISLPVFRFYAGQVKRHSIYEEKVSEQEALIIQQYFKILSMGRIIKMDQVVIGKTFIKTEDDMFKIEFDDSFFDIEKNFVKLKREIEKGDAKYNFNVLYELILKHSKLDVIQRYNTAEDEYKEFTKSKYIVNGMEIIVTKENNRIKINNIFCRIDDVKDILSKAICYNDIIDFNKYIKDVSHIGLEWKKLINNGVMIYLENPLFKGLQKIGRESQEKVIMRFSLLWDDTKRQNVYLIVNGKKYLIKYKGKFIKYFNTPERRTRLGEIKRILKNTLAEFDKDSIFEIVTNAVEEAKIIQTRGKELVECTIKDTGAKELTITLKEGNIKGFEIVGIRTNTKYFIDGVSLNVYRWDEGKWNRRCIVSDPNKQRIFEDRLANRLVNIYNENAKIYTLFN